MLQISPLNFDTIVIHLPETVEQKFTPDQFVQLPVNDRVKMILRGHATFFAKGSEVDKRASLAALRMWSASLH